jgi:hypothetical protein
MGPDDMKIPAALDSMRLAGIRSHPATRLSPNFKTDEGMKIPWRVRFPSASARALTGFGVLGHLSDAAGMILFTGSANASL